MYEKDHQRLVGKGKRLQNNAHAWSTLLLSAEEPHDFNVAVYQTRVCVMRQSERAHKMRKLQMQVTADVFDKLGHEAGPRNVTNHISPLMLNAVPEP